MGSRRGRASTAFGLRAGVNVLVCAAAAALFLAPTIAIEGVASQSGELRIFATRSIATVLAKVGGEFELRSGRKLNITTDVAARMVRRSMLASRSISS